MPDRPKDKWDKAAVILTPVGGLLTAIAVAVIGYSLNMRQAQDTNARTYADILTQRERADTDLRKDMFASAIKTFVGESRPGAIDKEILDLELLAYNFHESIDLGPIFKDVYERILDPAITSQKDRDRYRPRVERLAQEVIEKEISSLEVEGKLDGDVFFEEIKPEGLKVIDRMLSDSEAVPGSGVSKNPGNFTVTVLGVYPERREMRIKLEVRMPQAANSPRTGAKEASYVNSIFRLGFSDFPMIDNTRLPDGYRCAIVLRSFDDQHAKLTLVYFPNSRAALKEKPYYEEMLDELLRAKERSRN